MKKNKKIFLVGLTILVLLAISTFAVIHFRETDTIRKGIGGIVTSVINKPNRAEDGYYGIGVRASDGQQYIVNATGYLNTPLSPDSQGEACVDVPKVKVGDKVTFNLPKTESQPNTFEICYKKNLSGYYFNVQ